MAYGTIKVDNIVFTNAGSDQTITVSGLVASTSENLTVTGTISGNTIQGQTVSGVTVTGTTANFTSGNFTTFTGGTITVTSGVIASGTEANPSLSILGDANTGLYSPGADQLAISTGGSGRLFVNADGTILAGTGYSSVDGNWAIQANAGPGALTGIGVNNNGGYGVYLIYDNSARYSGAGVLRNVANSPLAFETSNTERLRITSAGLVGVGTSSPGNLLHVSGTSSTPATFERTGTTGTFVAFKDSTSLVFIGNTNGVFSIQTPGSSYSDKLVVTSAGNVGVGTTNPGSALDVAGEIRIYPASGDGNLRFGSGGVEKGRIAFNSSSNCIIETAGFERLRITSAGNVGIGVSAPQAILDVGTTFQAVRTHIPSVTDTFHQYRGTPDGAGYEHARVFSGRDTSVYTYGSYLAFYTEGKSSGTTDTSVERLRIDSSGRLLVGTSSARANFFNATETCQFQVEGTTTSDAVVIKNVDSTAGPNLILGKTRGSAIGSNTLVGNSDTLGSISFQGTDGTQFVEGAHIRAVTDGTVGADDLPTRLVFSTTADGASSPTPRMTINSAGDVLIGKTSNAATVVGAQIEAVGTITSTRSGSTSATSTLEVYSTGAAAYRFYVGMDGTVNATNTTISAISDQRLKENIRDLDVGLNEILALKPRIFDWKKDKGKNIKNDRGFVAQEFEEVFPELVDEWKDPAPEGEDPYKSVRQDLIPVLVKAIQEQQIKIKTLEAAVTALQQS
jgi:hypothetical protein